jgi:phosphotriesterase-related protein
VSDDESMVHTVRGPRPATSLGMTLVHEHVLMDFTCRYVAAADEGELCVEQPALVDRHRLLTRPAGYRVNLLRRDLDEAARELDYFVAAGGGTIVDLTTLGLHPDALGLRELADRADVHLVAATGVYIGESAPPWVREASVEALADHFTAQLLDGHPDGVLRGVIGEIGVEDFSDVELRCLTAAAKAQTRSGAAVFVHVLSGIRPAVRPQVEELVDLFVDAGGEAAKLVLCHQDGSGDDVAHQDRLLGRGVTLAYDTFGFESTLVRPDGFVQLPTDTQRIAEVARIVRDWGTDQVVLSHDLCYRMMLRSWGGWGWAHLLRTLPPRFALAGLDGSTMERLLIANPARLLPLRPVSTPDGRPF